MAKIVTDAGTILDLHRPYQSSGIHENGVELSNAGALSYPVAGHRCPLGATPSLHAEALSHGHAPGARRP
jgi:hypothetical protein